MSRGSLHRFYIWSVVVLGGVAWTLAVFRLPLHTLDLKFLALALVSVAITSNISIEIPRLKAVITVSDTVVFLTLILYGPEAAVLIAAAEAVISCLKICTKLRTILFNAAV